jgi:signal transduction histidine kinase
MGPLRSIGPLRIPRPDGVLVALGLATFVAGVYGVIVLGGGVLVGRTEAPSTALSVLATAAVALSFAPVQGLLERLARRTRGGSAATPYDVLSGFSSSVAGGAPAEELPHRMAMLLAQGTGAAWAQVWLRVSGRLVLAATWPADSAGTGGRALEVRHGDDVLGELRLHERPGVPLTAVEERLFSGLAAQAGLVLRLVARRAELEGRRTELTERGEELKASRERLIQAQDAERRRLERDLHDGAQQHLVALAVNLRLAETIARSSPERAATVLAGQVAPAAEAIETLSALSRGIYPRLLTEEGLIPALRSTTRASAITVSLSGQDVDRLPSPVEAALYFCCVEAVQNAAKHSGAKHVSVELTEDPGSWRLTITDCGTGFERAPGGLLPGAGLTNMHDRLDAVGGSASVTSSPGRGTTVAAVVRRPADGAGRAAVAPAVGRGD